MNTILETPRLFLRHPTIADAEFMLRLVNEPSWLQYIGDRNVHTLDDAQNYLLNGSIKSFETLGIGFFVAILKQTGTSIGMCGLVKRDFLDDIDIGFAFFPEYTGFGYALEAAKVTLDHARHQLGLNRILAITSKDNIRSIQLLEKIGLQFEKTILVEGEELNLYAINLSN